MIIILQVDDQYGDHDDVQGDHYEEIDHVDEDEQVDHDGVQGDHDEQGQHRKLPCRRAAAAPWTGDHQVLLIERGLDKSMMIIGLLHWSLGRNCQ